MNLDPRAFERMTSVQRAVSGVLNRANRERLPIELAVFAVVRVLRELLRMVPGEGKAMLTKLCIDFLRDEKAPTEDAMITLH